MSKTKPRITYSKLIGREIEIENHPDPTIKGLRGKVIDETMNTLVIRTPKGDKIIFKKGSLIRIYLHDYTIKVYGDSLVGRPEERVKQLITR